MVSTTHCRRNKSKDWQFPGTRGNSIHGNHTETAAGMNSSLSYIRIY